MDQQLHPEWNIDEFFALPELQPADGADLVGYSELGLSAEPHISLEDPGLSTWCLQHSFSSAPHNHDFPFLLASSTQNLAIWSAWEGSTYAVNDTPTLVPNGRLPAQVMGVGPPSSQDQSTLLNNSLLSGANGDRISNEVAKSVPDVSFGLQATPPGQVDDNGNRLICDHHTCIGSKKTYRGRWELNRHQSSHERTTQRFCPVVGCNRLRRKPFSRIDKLQLHIRGHGESALLRCPVNGCFVQPMALNLLCVHLQAHSWEQTKSIGVGGKSSYHNDGISFWYNLASGRVCPLSPCHKKLKNTDSLREHLRTKHDERGRLSQASVVLEVGIEPRSCDFVCPVCEQQWAEILPFQNHVLRHLLDIDHILLFVNLVRQIGGESQMTATELEDNLFRRYNSIWLGYGPKELSCPNCSFSVSLSSRIVYLTDLLKDHHAAMFNEAKVLSVRSEILCVYPGIDFHPVFDDLRRRDE